MRHGTVAVAVLLLAGGATGCGSAAGSVPAGELGVTARDAYIEARSVARAWDDRAELRYIEGIGIAATGAALPGAGEWRFHYGAPDRVRELEVLVTPLETSSEERPATSPPGYVLGDRTLDGSWVDSPTALSRVLEARSGGAPETASMLLVPTRPEQWVVRFPSVPDERWRVEAETGEVLS